MNTRNNNILYILILLLALVTPSCEDYLDRTRESEISDNDVFGNFISFQGFIEEMYSCIGDPHQQVAGNRYYNAYLDDSTLNGVPQMWDNGDYWFEQWSFLVGDVNTNLDATMTKKIWPNSWYAIRKANQALANLDLFNGTPEERNLIEGQAYFFRAFFHFELMRYYGGLPYVDTLLVASDKIAIPRLNYKQTALKVAADFRKAAELLPVNWDETTAGKRTEGNNNIRASKIEALGYLGRNLLYAASPMMNESSGGPNAYDEALCKEAAQAFADAIKLTQESGRFALEPWENRTVNFWIDSPGNNTRPGGKEVIRNQQISNHGFTRWTTVRAGSPVPFEAGNTSVEAPTHNYVENYGMANGLPLDDPESGYNPNDPWTGRDPRFYIDIVVDGDKMVNSASGGVHQYAQLYNGGIHKGGNQGSATGYFMKKYTPLGCNKWDLRWNNLQCFHPRLRLADIYLMYVEAVLWGYGSPTASVPGSNLTAVEAINVIRARANNMPGIHSKFLGSKEKFMGEIMRERAVELAFEGHRWFDLRRWNLLADMKYREKCALDFDRGANGKPINMQKRVVVTRTVEKKHNWVPFQVNDVSIYKEFPQNPGW